MSHKVTTLCLLVACFLGMSISLWGQNAAAPHGIPGYLDPRTGIFHSTPPLALPDAEPPAKTTFTGKLVFNFTITVKSTFASTAPIACIAAGGLSDSGITIGEGAGTLVTRGTGTTVTCSVTIPYSWSLATASTDTINLSYSIITAASFAAVAGEFPNRHGAQSLGKIAVPATGTTTTETIAATI